MDELYYSRRMAAIKRVEDRLAREQLNHRCVQRRAAEAALKQMIIDDLEGFEEDLNVYASTEDPDINKIIKSARSMLQVTLLVISLSLKNIFSHTSLFCAFGFVLDRVQNFMDCRVRFVDVLRRQVLAISTHPPNTLSTQFNTPYHNTLSQ